MNGTLYVTAVGKVFVFLWVISEVVVRFFYTTEIGDERQKSKNEEVIYIYLKVQSATIFQLMQFIDGVIKFLNISVAAYLSYTLREILHTFVICAITFFPLFPFQILVYGRDKTDSDLAG